LKQEISKPFVNAGVDSNMRFKYIQGKYYHHAQPLNSSRVL
jgi:hypothetical protein